MMLRHRPTLAVAVAAAVLIATPATAAAAPPGRVAAPGSASSESPAELVGDPTDYVDPFIGTGRGGESVGEINNFPGVSTPFGMMQFSPDTLGSYAGYQYHNDRLKGFSLNHASVGCTAFGDIPILPITGEVTDPANRTERYSHDNENAELGRYSVNLADSDIDASITATTRTGLAEFDYPAGSAAQVLVKAGSSLSGSRAAQVSVIGDNEVAGSSTTGGFCGNGNDYTVYFDIVFDRPFTAHGTWEGGTVTPGSAQASGGNSGAYLSFDTDGDTAVSAKVSMSYVSIDGARANMTEELPGWDFDAVAEQTRQQWRDLLGKVRVGGGTEENLASFYTALYHSLLHPNRFDDVDGSYIGFDDEIHQLADGQEQYANFSDWDTYRSLVPLQTMLLPELAGQLGNSLLRDAQQQGNWWPRWPLANGTTSQMNGDNSVPLYANLSAFGATGLDVDAALPILVKGATESAAIDWGWWERRGVEDYVRLGYQPNNEDSRGDHGRQGASQTLEWAIDDFAIAQLARTAGQHHLAAEFTARSQNWQNIFNPATGYHQPRDIDGVYPSGPAFVPPPAGRFGQDGFAEGNAAQYNYLVPQNMAGLIAAIGGDDVVSERLDEFFTSINDGPNVPKMWAGNEVNHSIPWVYNYLGQPGKTQDAVRRLQTELYSPTPDGAPGNDDLGAQSAWYVWAALGMYPVTPGTTDLSLNTPLFSAAEITLGNGQTIEIEAPGAGSDDARYIESVAVNGRAHSSSALPPTFALTGGTLSFDLGGHPGERWGTAAKDRPRSFQQKQAAAIGFSDPTGTLAVATGDAEQITIGAQGTGIGKTMVRWTADAPDGITVTPASGVLRAPSVGRAEADVQISVDPGTPSDFRAVTFDYRIDKGRYAGDLTPTAVIVANPVAGNTAIACETLGDPNQPAGVQQVENDDGVTEPVQVGGRTARATVGDRSNYMYFDIDDKLVPGGNYSAEVQVTYFDHGTGDWKIQYDSADPDEPYRSGASITRTGTDTWKTATFTLSGVAFRSRQNVHSDFRLEVGPGQAIGGVRVATTGDGLLAMHLCD